MQLDSSREIQLEPPDHATACMIWLHGLGADGNDFVPVAKALPSPLTRHARFIFPHAPCRPISINMGMNMRGWYDVQHLDLTHEQDEAGVRESARRISAYIDAQREAGIAASRIVLAGFSQGGAVALHAALRYPEALAGVAALSTYLPLRHAVAAERHPANAAIPIFMGHGAYDQVIADVQGELSRDYLSGLGYAVEWHSYPMQHSVCLEEIEDLAGWLKGKLE
jgi:phospholipase/carboxylesterase